MILSILVIGLVCLLAIGIGLFWFHQQTKNQQKTELQLIKNELQQSLLETLATNHINSLKTLQEGLQQSRTELSHSLRLSLQDNAKLLSERLDKLTTNTDTRLKEISGQVDKRLSDGFEKTNTTFNNILTRLALIDKAQKQIGDLSNDVVSLKDLLSDKRSRGAFGEVQLTALIRNVLPEKHFALQSTLSNGNRPDCILFLPEPTGNMVIDAKFPLETYQKLTSSNIEVTAKHTLSQQFRRDIKKHINDIATKYIIANETAEGAIMFIPAEAVFAEIHANYPDIVEASHKAKVWMASPTTMMAILTTVRAVLKDDATRKQIHLIQEHLTALSVDFGRFQKRMDGLQRHIGQANKDVQEVNVSARKISSRFEKIEKVEINPEFEDQSLLEVEEGTAN